MGMKGKVQYVQGKDGRMKGSISLQGKEPPSSAEKPSKEPTGAAEGSVERPEVDYANAYKAFQGKTFPKRTGKVGTDIPPLVVEVPDKGRFYVADPSLKPYVQENLEDALSNGQAFPSVTTCLGALDKPAITYWATGLVAEAAEARLYALAEANEEERQNLLDAWLTTDRKNGRTKFRKEITNAHEEKKNASANRGTSVHAVVEGIIHNENPEIPKGLEGYVDAFHKFQEENPNVEFIYTEATVLNEEDGAMGTADGIVRINEKYYILDFKTNKKGTVYETTGMQLAATANGQHIVYEDGAKEPLPPIAGGIGVGLSPKGEYGLFFFETEKNGANHQGFKAAANAWRWQHKHSSGSEKLTPEMLKERTK